MGRLELGRAELATDKQEGGLHHGARPLPFLISLSPRLDYHPQPRYAVKLISLNLRSGWLGGQA